jgi:hypothetical protein
MFCLLIGHLTIRIFAELFLYVCARTVLEVIYGKKKSSVIFQGVAWNSEKA